jgi:NADP-dependent alcohol dehydrogenase
LTFRYYRVTDSLFVLKFKQIIVLNFELYNPVNYVFEKGQIEKLKDLVPANTNLLITYGGTNIFENGVSSQVEIALSTQFEKNYIVEFGGIEPHPKYETLLKAIEIVLEQ